MGRWESYQKNLPLLLKSLRALLDHHPNYNALVIGSGLSANSRHPRIYFIPPLLPVALSRKMQESKFFLSTSRYESFGLAAAEARACGCALLDVNMIGPSGRTVNLDSTEEKINISPKDWFAKGGRFSLEPRRIANEFLRILSP